MHPRFANSRPLRGDKLMGMCANMMRRRHLAAIQAAFLGAACLGCDQNCAQQIAFRDIPRIETLTNSNSAMPCMFVRTSSPHTVWVRVLGEATSQTDLMLLLPILEGEESYPGADSFLSRMPEVLANEVTKRGGFVSTDRYWVLPKSSKTSRVSGYIAFSQSAKLFYLDYHWDQ